MTTIETAEARWREAYDAHDRRASAQTIKAEQDAWDAYAELCDEAGQCLQPGCRTTTTEYAYCPAHREN